MARQGAAAPRTAPSTRSSVVLIRPSHWSLSGGPELFTVDLTVGHSMLRRRPSAAERVGRMKRKVVVVGAGSGIGAAVAKRFHDNGDHVLAVDVREHQTPATEYVQCDLRDPAGINALLGRIGSGWDMLAHVAGIPGTAPAADVLKVNYLGMRLMTEGMLPPLREGESVVAVASTAG